MYFWKNSPFIHLPYRPCTPKSTVYNSIIDWTTTCVHPVVWEIIRFYVYASPLCVNGGIDINELTDYVKAYLWAGGKLSAYDLENMGRMFFYFTAVCDFYGQYYDSLTRNRKVYLEQAQLSSKLLRWLDGHVEELTKALSEVGRSEGLQ